MWEDRAYRFARGALDPPDGDATQADTSIMRVARQAPTAVTGRLVKALKAEGEEEREYAFNKGLAVAKQLKVGRFVSKIDGDGPVFAGPFGVSGHRGSKEANLATMGSEAYHSPTSQCGRQSPDSPAQWITSSAWKRSVGG